ncbi:hypothetical protein M513_03429 [Trichuris suis]|uniref:Uncharacterized protein n=1 Tax=Trichuris suis TaxID=68888 RepID=A0A085MEN5_9BILA|nr:hypothetical protein M513_03429 [Trichuris suis]
MLSGFIRLPEASRTKIPLSRKASLSSSHDSIWAVERIGLSESLKSDINVNGVKTSGTSPMVSFGVIVIYASLKKSMLSNQLVVGTVLPEDGSAAIFSNDASRAADMLQV